LAIVACCIDQDTEWTMPHAAGNLRESAITISFFS